MSHGTFQNIFFSLSVILSSHFCNILISQFLMSMETIQITRNNNVLRDFLIVIVEMYGIGQNFLGIKHLVLFMRSRILLYKLSHKMRTHLRLHVVICLAKLITCNTCTVSQRSNTFVSNHYVEVFSQIFSYRTLNFQCYAVVNQISKF